MRSLDSHWSANLVLMGGPGKKKGRGKNPTYTPRATNANRTEAPEGSIQQRLKAQGKLNTTMVEMMKKMAEEGKIQVTEEMKPLYVAQQELSKAQESQENEKERKGRRERPQSRGAENKKQKDKEEEESQDKDKLLLRNWKH